MISRQCGELFVVRKCKLRNRFERMFERRENQSNHMPLDPGLNSSQ